MPKPHLLVMFVVIVPLAACGRARELSLEVDRWPNGEILPPSFALHPEATFSPPLTRRPPTVRTASR
jgi:hypothetical protein